MDEEEYFRLTGESLPPAPRRVPARAKRRVDKRLHEGRECWRVRLTWIARNPQGGRIQWTQTAYHPVASFPEGPP